MSQFDLKKFLIENKLTTNSRELNANAIDESEQLNENDAIISYRNEKKIPIKFTGFEKFDGSDGKYDSTDDQGRYTVRIKAERVDGEKLAGKYDKFSVQVRTTPDGNKITQDGAPTFPDFDQDSFKPEIVDFGKTLHYVKKNISK